MIKCYLSRILGEKRITMTSLSQQTGLSRNTIYLLYHEKSEGITFKTLEKICAALECQPGDLLIYVNDEK